MHLNAMVGCESGSASANAGAFVLGRLRLPCDEVVLSEMALGYCGFQGRHVYGACAIC